MNERLAQLYREAGLQPAWQRQPEAQPGYTPPRPRPRQMRPAIQRLYDPNQGVRDQAGAQVRQERELAALSDRAMGGYSGYADRNQVEEFGRGAMEMTGAPAWARGIQDVQNGRPGEAIPEFLWGALNTAGIAALPLGGGARPATPPRVPRDLPSRLRVYHGSPHQFDQFDAARIGSGEGAQAYGHGLYVAEADDVGQAYRQQLSGPDGGYLYEGYLSGRPSEFIDLDAPVANQPRRVQEFISELYELPIAELRRRRLRPVIVGEAEAQRAQQAGFAGLRYLDEGSRASGRGTRNYVVFDPNRVEWDVRNGALTRPPPNAANAYRVSEGSSSPANTVIAEPQLPPQVRSGPNAQALPEPIPSAVRPQRPPATASPDAGQSGAGNRVVYRGLNRPYDPANGGYYQSFTSSLDDAREYGPNVIAAHINPGRNLAIDGGGNNFNALSVEQLSADVRARLHPSVGASATTDQIAHAAREAGYDSVTVRNVHDNRWGERPVRGAEPRTIDFVFDTANIRPLDNIPPQASEATRSAEKVKLTAADRALLDELGVADAPDGGASGAGNAGSRFRYEGPDRNGARVYTLELDDGHAATMSVHPDEIVTWSIANRDGRTIGDLPGGQRSALALQTMRGIQEALRSDAGRFNVSTYHFYGDQRHAALYRSFRQNAALNGFEIHETSPGAFELRSVGRAPDAPNAGPSRPPPRPRPPPRRPQQ